ncbi:uncharacterized protein [Oryza sativa Japonica Group]|uniref:Os06g0324000 protein n=2 Tax=Oryza sativa subsp. japonica TaxID=39947 RepID=Q0DCI8_ORYSJ|nr:pistil-specific extensin-like protein [Oryza sativa Japonica Group]BAD61864.1 unknown protein [Oryza sativa Japonica Group]BAF19435.1 Os06g0324000 [Oryza sativa Japonica Group]BAG98823.1 unnamed protein product [Oryza sativa Japonica Group]|eukprot:NP_001057521.1 Os06g0324000 [Oryza sativa Japonica Group]
MMTTKGFGAPKLLRSASAADCRRSTGNRPTPAAGSARHCRAPCRRLRAPPLRLVVTQLHPPPLRLAVAHSTRRRARAPGDGGEEVPHRPRSPLAVLPPPTPSPSPASPLLPPLRRRPPTPPLGAAEGRIQPRRGGLPFSVAASAVAAPGDGEEGLDAEVPHRPRSPHAVLPPPMPSPSPVSPLPPPLHRRPPAPPVGAAEGRIQPRRGGLPSSVAASAVAAAVASPPAS